MERHPNQRIKCTDPDCVAAIEMLSFHDLEIVRSVLIALDNRMSVALHAEERYSKKHGYEQGHYWLRRKIEDVIGMAIQDVADHLKGTAHT